ncbi:hypothetical protein NDU88_004128 [Pleurodeles waltl]|uniref:Putative nuclease HARBI1 n=1 Tax=Pleurodeles waltl TaxID=8319 RepID=A0AAV7T7N6_PLEWA|nr:hypothetical protein NDU88_004128 [Pleurodeles waltl]
MAVTSAAGRIITAGAPVHWLLGPIGSNVNQCSSAPRSTTAYRDGVQRQRGYPTIPLSQNRQLGHMRRWQNPPVYRPLVDLLTIEERHLIVTYRFDRATIQELCTQLEPDLMSPIRHPTGIPPDVQVLSVLHFFASGSFHTTVAMASGMSQSMFSNVLSKVLSAVLKHVRRYIIFPQVEDLPTVKGDFYAPGHIPNVIGAIDGTHVALPPPHRSEQVYRNRKSYHSMNVQMVCLADQYISQVNAMFPGSVHDAYILRNSSIHDMMLNSRGTMYGY